MHLISIIVPLAPGETVWQALLPQLLAMDMEKEILLLCADADSHILKSATRDHPCIHVLSGGNGRAASLNNGALKSNGSYLWFLHADSLLPEQCPDILHSTISSDIPALYYFDLQFLRDGPRWMRMNTLGVYFRSHCLKMPFGDQGFFLEKKVFMKIGPFNEQAKYGEDHLLVWQAHHQAIPVLPIGATLMTSARKYSQRGWLTVTISHLYLTARQALPLSFTLLKQRFLSRRGC
jgi:hypothetical protein